MRKKTSPESESVVDRLAHDPKGNTIRTSAGFMVVAKDGEHGEELSEDQIKLSISDLVKRIIFSIPNEAISITQSSKTVAKSLPKLT